MLNNKGSILIEALISLSIVIILVTTIIPITSLLQQEGKGLDQRRLYTTTLHDELQAILWNPSPELPLIYEKEVDSASITFSFVVEEELIKGCAQWKNVKNKMEKSCLYGYMPK